jgi:hypothetical protein
MQWLCEVLQKSSVTRHVEMSIQVLGGHFEKICNTFTTE